MYTYRAENFRMVDIKIYALTPGFTNTNIILKRIRYPRKKFKIQTISVCEQLTLIQSDISPIDIALYL